ncbi:major facilitator superfamily domain-containing protein 6-like protein B [Homarus americanus]|uniref:major facilitator superfamily domain-containing protein 6-like protein B n=1 Tax=Homarus americanus TaxID=6706 RepID=UPI001C468403|nr:major facilitator superfamily domain-containing protein 6-like protein B [Homarus americanus]
MLVLLNVAVASRIEVVVSPRKKHNTISARFCSLRILLLLVTTAEVVETSFGMLWTFLFILMEDVSQAWYPDFTYLELLQGLALGIDCLLGEVPFMFLSSYTIQHLGHLTTIAVSLASFSTRFLQYSFVSNPWFFLAIELLHGMSFGLILSSVSSYASVLAPKGAEATVHSLVRLCLMFG